MNKKIQKVVALSLASMTLLSGCGAKTIPTLENGDQAIVTFNDDVKISITDSRACPTLHTLSIY